ncbi:MFS transporter [candidate division BRC1 bacterium HGW-BRC1-1]|jgi:MFS family permease|nr:MAG: MFS transporter [candidate division BRC1 bacterium HGW-BRC1-1]
MSPTEITPIMPFEDTAPPPKTRRFPEIIRSLRHKNYRLFTYGQIVSVLGMWVQSTVLQWMVYTLTDSAFLLGVIGFAGQIPMLIIASWAGVLAENIDRHKAIKITQSLGMVQAVVLAGLTLARGPDGGPLISYWHILSLTIFMGVVQSFDMPIRQAFLVQMVPRPDLGNAVALNSLSFNIARVIGPAFAGMLVVGFARWNPGFPGFGEGLCFVINALTYLAVLFQLWRIKPSPQVAPNINSRRGQLREAIRYARSSPHLSAMLILVAMVAVFGLPYLMLMPVFAKSVFNGDISVNASLMSSIGVGAILGGIIMARRKRIGGLGRLIAISLGLFSIVAMGFSWSQNLTTARIMLVGAGACIVCTMIGAQSLLQLLVPDEYRGRMMGLYTMASMGFMPFGNLFVGALAEKFGPRQALTFCSVVCLMISIWLWARMPAIRKSARATEEYRILTAANG